MTQPLTRNLDSGSGEDETVSQDDLDLEILQTYAACLQQFYGDVGEWTGLSPAYVRELLIDADYLAEGAPGSDAETKH